MNFQMWPRASVAFTLLALTSCAAARSTNLTPAYLDLAPTVSNYQDPNVDFSNYRTFSVFPASLISDELKTNEILEKQLLFFLRSCLEAKGYKFVPADEKPDFLATITATSDYRQSYVPPSTGVMPVWVPGQAVTTFGTSIGSIDYASGTSYGWGTYSGASSTTTFVPGYVSSRTYTTPGYTVGHYYPTTAIGIYDTRTLKNVWLGTGVGTSDNSDVRVAAQLVITRSLAGLPAGSTGADAMPPLGLAVEVFTVDGNNYVPTVVGIAKGGLAEKAGVRAYDMILSINGTSLVNKPYSEAVTLLEGEPGARATIQVWRNDRELTLDVAQ